MKYGLLFLIFLSFSCFNLYSQAYSLKEGVPSNSEMKPVKIIGIYNDHIVSINKQNDEYYIVQYDTFSLKPTNIKLRNLSYKGNKLFFIDVVNLLGTDYIFSFYSNPKSETAIYIYQKIDLKKLKLGEAKKWSESYFPISHENKGFFKINESMDGTKKVIINSLDNHFDNMNRVMISVYDLKTSSKWQRNVKLPFKLTHFKFSEVSISNNGKVFFTGKEYPAENFSSKKNKQNYQYQLLSYFPKTDKLLNIPFEFKAKKILNLRMAFTKQQQLIMAAVSYERKDSNYYYTETYIFDESTKQFKYVDKSEMYFYNLYNESVKTKKHFFPYTVCHDIMKLGNGNSFVFSSEQRIISRYYVSLPPIFTYSFLQTAITIIDSTAHIVKQLEIKKHQMLNNNTYSHNIIDKDYYNPITTSPFSYISFTNENNFYYLYNEEKKNINKKVWNRYFAGRLATAYPFICIINSNSSVKYYPLNAEEGIDMMLLLNTFYKSNEDIYIFAKQNNAQVLLKLSLLSN